MKITITSETTGEEIQGIICSLLAGSDLKLNVQASEIKAQVTNKEGKWVDFDANKIRFVYSK
jgi:hypothetical protein